MRAKGGRATTDQLRDDIDRGRTGDKVAFPDPAAAPLGTDAEAAGTPPDAAMAAESRNERARADRVRGEKAGVLARTWAILLAAIALIVFLMWAALR
jgi:hypothetical protein